MIIIFGYILELVTNIDSKKKIQIFKIDYTESRIKIFQILHLFSAGDVSQCKTGKNNCPGQIMTWVGTKI